MTFQQIQKYEKGTNRISTGRLLAIASALKVGVGDLLRQDGRPAEAPLPELTREATRQLRAFQGVRNAKVRASLVKLAETLAEASPGKSDTV